ncbi:uncharacterized protein [Rutidosis leptorrhynchoides]|uniref:uncharacterized protein n=1 Tax=Rutidosis leptorrhynchoides TaxID=125765 RepID=UPI003A9A38C7
MPELAFLDQHNRRFRSSYGGGAFRDFSPETVMHSNSIQDNSSLFSSSASASASASASVDRCSSSSDVIDRESLVSDMSMNLSGGFRGCLSSRGSDPDPNKSSTIICKNGGPYIKGEKAEAIKGYHDAETDGENQSLFSARSSFSKKEYQNRKSKSEILLRKFDRRRPASMDMNNQMMNVNVTSSSPRLAAAMKSSDSAQKNCMFSNPGTPSYRPASVVGQKGWSSERVPLSVNANRITLMGYNNNNNGRTLPSKWEDAERWIISPVAGDGVSKPLVQEPQRRPKAKSGPLGPHGSAFYSMYSPTMPSFQRGNMRNVVTESPSLTAVNVDNNSTIRYQNGFESNDNLSTLMDHGIMRSVSLHGCSELLTQSMSRINHDDKTGSLTDAGTDISRDVSRRDMATQMSHESSPCSSPNRTTFSSLSTSILSVDLQHIHASKVQVRDVQVDDLVTLTPSFNKNRAQTPGTESDISKNENSDIRYADWEVSEMKKTLSSVKREEAKITAWENLQKAKAEAAIRKLEMKLEKKRSSSMDKIMHKLRSSQKRAKEMRESVLSTTESRQVAKSSHKAISLIKTRHIRSLSGCFTCPAF